MRHFTLLFALCLAAFSLAQRPIPAETPKALLDRLQVEHPGSRVYREGVKVSRVYGAPLGYGFTPEQSAAKFVLEYGSAFEPGDGKLEFETTRDLMDGKFTAVYYKQTVMGRPIEGASLVVLVLNDVGSPIVYVNSNVQPSSLVRSIGQISSNEAVNAAKRGEKGLNLETTPYIVGWHGEEQTHLAWKFVLGNADLAHPRRFTFFVDASTGTVLQARDEVYFTDVSGHVGAMATPGLNPNQANNPPALVNLVDVTARINGGNSVRTDASGNFTIPNAGTGSVNVISELMGSWARAVNSAGTNEVLSQNVTPPGPANFTFNSAPSEFVQSQVDGFISAQVIHNFAKAINASYPGIDIQIPVNVNINNSCNAFYSASTVNFYRAGGGCPNTAYSTVVYHEYGHFIIDKGHSSPTGDYHEGVADVTASLASNSPCLGNDFRGQGTGCLRSTYNSVVHPCSGESHLCGQVISGAFWLTKDQLDTTIGPGPALTLSRSLYLNSILLQPSDINPGVTIDVLTLDDNDGNINNGTPHYTEIAAGFGAKNLDAPELEWLSVTPLSVPGDFSQIPSFTRRMTLSFNIANNVGVLDPTTPRLVLRVDGGAWQESNLVKITSNSPHLGFIVVPNDPAIVEWYVKAKDTMGREVTWPKGDPAYTAFGHSLATTFMDTFSTDMGWTVTNTSLTSGAWLRADPNGSFLNGIPANPENDSNDSGTFCAFTGQANPGQGAGTADVDGGPTTWTSPTFDLSGGNGIIDWQQWFFNDDGDDMLTVQISNNGGSTWTTVSSTTFTGVENSWNPGKILVGNYVVPTNNMRVRFSTSDNPNNSVTEAAIDAFRVRRLQ